MASYSIILGNKNYSSWSLRAWLMLKATGVDFTETVIPLYESRSKEKLLAHSETGLVPVLKHGEVTVWDSLAIGEYLAEQFPESGLWPNDTSERAHARSISAEMHAGFAALRDNMPMDIRAFHPDHTTSADVERDIRRITDIWNKCRACVSGNEPFLFGSFSIADAMFAPVASRFRTYATRLDPISQAYIDALHKWPPMAEWIEAGIAEPYTIDSYQNPED